MASLLVADSGHLVGAGLRRRLVENGYDVIAAHSARQALKLAQERRPHLLIVDSQLRGPADGRSLCQQVKHDDSLDFLPVILTVNPHDGCYEDDLESEADAMLLKPVDPDELLSWVRFLLRLKRQFDRLMHENRRLALATKQAEMLKNDIIRNVKHEMATPLLQVKSAIWMLAEDIEASGTPEQAQKASMAAKSIGRLEGVVENIRQLAQAHDIHLGPIRVSESIDLAMRHMERSWASREDRARIETFIDPDLPIIRADKRALARLLQLLLDNALKFSPANSPVYVHACVVPDDQVWIGIQDFGIGIAAKEHSRIFQAFYQVDGSVTRQHGGTGTGLALALLLAAGMNTVIHVDSELGEGSTFWFVLPVATPDDFDLDLL